MPTFPPVGRAARSRRLRSHLLSLVAALAAFFGVASPASASHLQGGYFTANVTASGHLQGTLTYLEVYTCPSGLGSQKALSITITSPTGETVNKSVATTATKCPSGGSTYEGSFDFPLDGTTFSNGAPDGNYTLEWTSGNRIYNIVNLANSGSKSVRFRAQVRKVTGVATSAPFLGSDIATGIGIGDLYSQNLNASDPDDVLGNGTLTYEALTGDPDLAPDTNVIDVAKVQANGQIEIPPSTTSGMANNSYYVYKVRVTDDQGDYAERDVLLRAVTPNHPPVISGLNTSTGYDIAAGATQTITFSALDPDSGNVVKISGAGLPSWAQLTQTSGNPAQATLTLTPPADANTRTYHFNFDATDDDSNQVLVGSNMIEVRVAGSPETQLKTWPSAVATTDTATFTFAAADPSYTFDCSIDGGTTWAACSTPKTYTGLTDGPHTFKVRANDGTNVDPSPASYTWIVDATAPVTTFSVKPPAATTATTANFQFSATDATAVTYECSLDGASFSSCSSPKAYAGLADGSHTLRVRGTDASGHVESPAASYTWVIDRTAPNTTIGTKPAAISGPTAHFSVSSSESPVTYECQLDAGSWAACPDPLTFSGLAQGSHTVSIRAVDAAGNADATPDTYTWTVDTTKPAPPALKQSPSPNAQTSTFVVDREDAATLECQIDGGAWVPCDATWTPDVEDGPHTVKVRQTDAAGNVSDPVQHTWLLDRQAPEPPTVLGGPTGTTTDRTATFDFSAEAGATIECRIDGYAWVPCSAPLALSDLALGDHTLELRATDAAGNTSPVRTATWSVGKKAEAPNGPVAVKVDISKAVSVDPKKSTVGCSLTGVNISACTVDIYVRKSELGLAEAGSAGDTLVKIGTGKAVTDKSTGKVAVKITLNERGKQAMAQPGGVKVRVNIKAQPTSGGDALYAHKYTRIRPATQMVVPSDGLFATDSAEIGTVGRRYLQSIATGLYGAKGVQCVGHTDAQGAAAYNAQLGLARAKAVCGYLTRLGVKAGKQASSLGESRPRATNRTAAGRQLNRRVELSVSYE